MDNSVIGESGGLESANSKLGNNMIPKKTKKNKKNRKKDAPSSSSGASAAAAAAASAPAPAPAPAPASAPTYISTASSSSGLSVSDESGTYTRQSNRDAGGGGLDSEDIDHKVIKEWVINVASGKTQATASQVHRYFKGRIDPPVVIDAYLDAFNNNCREAVIKCAELLDIFLQPEEEAELMSEDAEEDEDDDLIGGAFASNIVMGKRYQAKQEDKKKARPEHKKKLDSKKLISQKLHPAYSSNKPVVNSYRPPSIPAGKMPDEILDVPPHLVGWVIGTDGTSIKDLQRRTSAGMWVDQDFPDGEMRKLHIHGNASQVEAAIREVKIHMSRAPIDNSRPEKGSEYQAVPPGHPDIVPTSSVKGYGQVTRTVDCPHSLVGYLIGTKGAVIKHIKDHSKAHVKVDQDCLPDGVPRKVIISGLPEAVDSGVCMVQEVIAAGKATTGPGDVFSQSRFSRDAKSCTTVNPPELAESTGTGPVLGFSSSASQDSSSSIQALTNHVGHMGVVGSGAAESRYAFKATGTPPIVPSTGPQNHQHQNQLPNNQQRLGTQNGVGPLYGGLVASAASPPMAVASQKQQQWQQQHQQQHHLLCGGSGSGGGDGDKLSVFPGSASSRVTKNGTINGTINGNIINNNNYQHHHDDNFNNNNNNNRNTLGPPSPGLPPPLVVQDDNNNGGVQPLPAGNSSSSSSSSSSSGSSAAEAFASVEELLVSVGYPALLPNFLNQEFDVTAIALMTDKDFEAISVPKGPQLKIQNACRKAGLLSESDDVTRAPAAFYGSGTQSGSTTDGPASSSDGAYDPSECKICFDREIEVTFAPCGHQMCCLKCGKEQEGRPCPSCCQVILAAVKFYRP